MKWLGWIFASVLLAMLAQLLRGERDAYREVQGHVRNGAGYQ